MPYFSVLTGKAYLDQRQVVFQPDGIGVFQQFLFNGCDLYARGGIALLLQDGDQAVDAQKPVFGIVNLNSAVAEEQQAVAGRTLQSRLVS